MSSNLLVFGDRVSLCSFGAYPGPCSGDQAGFELRDAPASVSRVLGLKVCEGDLAAISVTPLIARVDSADLAG